jgi:hypothetical protein
MRWVSTVLVTGVIPWISAAPPPAPVPPVAPKCRAAQLDFNLELQGATGSSAGGVLLRNRGPSPCSLLGRVEVRLLDGSDPSGVEVTKLAPERPEPGIPSPSLRALRPGEHAFVRIWWSNWCGDPPPTKVGLRLPAGDQVVLRHIPLVPRCDAPDGPSTIGVGRPASWVGGSPAPSTRLPLSASIVENKAFGPKVIPLVHGRRGHTAVYHIALTNTSSRPFHFGAACPTYVESVDLDTGSELHVLNCRPVGTMRPAARVVFEMRIRVPPGVRPGKHPLTWELTPASYLPPFAGGVIMVTR